MESRQIVSDPAAEQEIGAIVSEAASASKPSAKVRPSFVSSLFFIAGGQVATVALAALTEFCIARLLGPAQQGRISLCLMSIVFGAVIGSIGSEATVVVWISQAKGERATWFPAVMFWVTCGSVLACVFWGLAFWQWHLPFLKGLTSGLAGIVLAAIPGTVLFSILMSLLVGEERFQLRSVTALVNRASGLAIFLLCVFLLGRRPETALIGYLGGLAVGILIASGALRHFLRDMWKLGEARQSLIPTMVFGFRGQTGTLATFVSYRLDVFVVNYFLDATQVGLYALGVLVSEALWQLPGIVSTALCPRTARTIGAGADSFTCTVLRQVFLVTLVTGLVVALASPVALPFVFGKRFAPSVPVVWWIMPGTIMFSLGKVSGADLIGRGLNIYTPISSYLGMAITLVLDWYLIPRMGIQGAALASSIAYFVAGGYLVIVLKRELKTSWRNLLLPTRNELLAYKRVWMQIRERFKRGEATIAAV
jgi:stage V sporulation protein B